MEALIPKRIIQIWGGGQMPNVAKAAAVNAKLLHPDFEYLLFDDLGIEEFVSKNAPRYESVLNSFKYRIQKYDFFRYVAIYFLGGFYLDLDVFLYKKITRLTDYSCVFPFERIGVNKYLKRKYNMHWDIGNYAFGATAGHPFMKAIIENCIRAQSEPEWLETMLRSIPRIFRRDAYIVCSTGPGIVTRTYAENCDLSSSVKVLMPQDPYDITNWNQFGNYGFHLMTSFWRKKKNRINRIALNLYYGRQIRKNIKLARKMTHTL